MTAQNTARVIIVLGMHRSGTSALAGTFDALGFSLGDELLPANAQANPKGYFEHAQVVQVHERLLDALGMDWADPRPLPDGWLRHPAAREARTRVQALVGELTADGAVAVLKDPRMCRFLPLWLEVLDTMGVAAHFAFIARHPLEVAASLRRRDDMSGYRAGLLTLAHQLEAERATRGRSRLFLTYEDLVADWRAQLSRCYAAFDLGAVPLGGPEAEAVDGFLDAGLRNHRAGDEYTLDPMVAEVYGAVRAAAAGAAPAAVEPAFDAVWPRFEASRRDYAASVEAALSALAIDQQRQGADGQALGLAWNAVPVDDARLLSPLLYLRRADGEYSEGARLQGRATARPEGDYEAVFEVAAELPLERLRFDPDSRAGVYAVDAIRIDGRPVPDLRARLRAMHESPLCLPHEGIGWVAQGDDPWVEFDLQGFGDAPVPGQVRRVEIRFRRPTSHALAEEAAVRRHAQQGERIEALAQRIDGVDRTVAAVRESNAGDFQRLETQARTMERTVQALGGTLAALGGTLAAQGQMIEALSATLTELKHRSDRPFLYRLQRKLAERRQRGQAARQGWALAFEPLANVTAGASGWTSRNADPQLSVRLAGIAAGAPSGIRAGWHLLTLESQVFDGHLGNPCLYPAFGLGTSEEDRIDLPEFDADGRMQALIHLRGPVAALRLDPSNQDAHFSLQGSLRPIGRPAALLRMARHVWRTQGGTAGERAGLLREAAGHLFSGGPRRMRKAIFERYAALQRSAGSDYASWLERFEPRMSDENVARRLDALARRPLLSVVMPVYQAPERWLRQALDSVIAQAYPDWELCIADDASPSPHVRKVLEEYRQRDSRIRVVYRERNGHISESSNSALELATGEFAVLLDHDDELHPEALLLVAEAVVADPEVKLVYSDEDKLDESGNRYDPYFKPDWNHDLLLGQNCISHLGVYSLPLLREVGGFRKGYEGSQDWDLALRCAEKLRPEQIHHIPRVLYHWRAIQGSTALGVDQKSYTVIAAQKAVQSHLDRTGVDAQVEFGPMNVLRVRRALPSPLPMVSLVIPTRDHVGLLRMCVESILARSTYGNYEILVVDNGSVEPETLAYFAELAGKPNVRVLPYPHPFNYSAINNFAVAQARGEIIGLVNNDIEVITPGWMEEMVAQALRPEIGAVGAMLYYPDDTIQHAGVLVGVGGVAAHIGSRQPRGSSGYFSRQLIAQQLSAVTAACLLVRRQVYEEVGGLDERLKVAFNDIDFCLRLVERGYRNLWTPDAELYHHESASRGLEDNPEKLARFMSEIRHMQQRWGAALARDPAYNPNLSLEGTPFTLAWSRARAPSVAGP
ncbi:glycosyltransferase [Pseudoxanthomonas jiangsuensis]|uniref:glycosyltransferase n=1 Tax=Pseudoxanthomonas jiangsuensis TaxID=619688 RepID=UPI001390BB67|nr:glycosyltransferase [Pseudoxanthomonas jiangsuensis]